MKEKKDERIKNIPDKIYLQVGDNIGWEVDFKELEDTGEVTWCSDKIENWDIEYIRASELERLVNQEVEKRIAGVMPTKNEIGNAAQLFDKQKRPLWKEAIWRAGANWAVDIIRSRLSQKTEGGGE